MIEYKYRKNNRMQSFDYSSNSLCFVTIVVDHHSQLLGQVRDKRMYKSNEGEIIEKQWFWLQEQYAYILLHSFIVMPDHFHGIIEIDSSLMDYEIKIKPLSQIIGAFKTTTSKLIHQSGNKYFRWQRSFHDRIIRDENEYEFMTNYIKENPANWDRRDRS